MGVPVLINPGIPCVSAIAKEDILEFNVKKVILLRLRILLIHQSK
jgi:hypothetical protein